MSKFKVGDEVTRGADFTLIIISVNDKWYKVRLVYSNGDYTETSLNFKSEQYYRKLTKLEKALK